MRFAPSICLGMAQAPGRHGSTILPHSRHWSAKHGRRARCSLVGLWVQWSRSNLRVLKRPACRRWSWSAQLSGQYDRVTSPQAALALASALPGAHAVVIRRAAHAPFLSHPDEFLAHVLPFIETKIAA